MTMLRRISISVHLIAGILLLMIFGSSQLVEGKGNNHKRAHLGSLGLVSNNGPEKNITLSNARLAKPASQLRVARDYGHLPLRFEENNGQYGSQMKFVSQGSNCTLFLTANEAVMALRRTSAGRILSGPKEDDNSPISDLSAPADWAFLHMKLLGCNPRLLISGQGELPGKSNHFIGNDPKKWHTNVSNYAAVRYAQVYPGINLVFYGNQQQLEYDFVVTPGSDPRAIRLGIVEGETTMFPPRLAIDSRGDLLAHIGHETVRFHKPVVYQESEASSGAISMLLPVASMKIPWGAMASTKMIGGQYDLKEDGEIGFKIASYDSSRPLIIDPVVSYISYIGGSGWDEGSAVAVDKDGFAYIAGDTYSGDLPEAGSLQPYRGSSDCFVTKINPTGDAIVYSAFLGGGSWDGILGIALDTSSNVVLTGKTWSGDFPVHNAIQAIHKGSADAFIAKLNSNGNALIFSTYLGGCCDDYFSGIAADSSGNIIVAGETFSSDFPTTNGAFQTNLRGSSSAFVAKMPADGSQLLYASFLGGDGGMSFASRLALDSLNRIYIVGATTSSSFPITSGAYHSAPGGYWDAFVAKMDTTLSGPASLIYSTVLGGSDKEIGRGIAVDQLECAFIAGLTYSNNFPTTTDAYQAGYQGNGDAFMAKLDAAGANVLYSTFLGGSLYDEALGIALDRRGNTYITGGTLSANFPLINPAQGVLGGVYGLYGDGFVTILNPTIPGYASLQYSTFLGGNNEDIFYDIALDQLMNIYVVGMTSSDSIVASAEGFQGLLGHTNRGWRDAFIIKLQADNQPPAARILSLNGPVSVGAACISQMTLDGSQSQDPDGDPLTYSWSGPFGSAIGPTPTVTLPKGTYTITLTVNDGKGGTASDSVVVTVIDQTPPAIDIAPGPRTINIGAASQGIMPDLTGEVAASDNCTPASLLRITQTPAAGSQIGPGISNVTIRVEDESGNASSATTKVTVSSATVVKLTDSKGNGIAGGIVQYYSGSWLSFGTTGLDGQVAKQIPLANYSFRITWAGGVNDKVQNVATAPTVAFQTINAAVQLKDSTGAPLDTGTVQYYAGSWLAFGTTSGGQVSKELLPGTYSFRMTYAGTSNDKAQNTAVDPTIIFRTTTVLVQLKDSSGMPLDIGIVQYYGTSWLPLGTKSGGQTAKELLPGTWSFRMTYGGFNNDKSQNVGVNPVVVFQTVRVGVQLADSGGNPLDAGTIQYYAGAWNALGITSGGQANKELLPGAYSFRMIYAGGSLDKSQDVGSAPIVRFQTGKVVSASNTCTTYYAGAWRTFVNGMELLPGSYPFRFSSYPQTSYPIMAGTSNTIY